MTTAEFEYSLIPARALAGMKDFFPDEDSIAARYAAFAGVAPRPGDNEGDTEVLDGVTFTHHFVDAPGDHETVRFHYVEAGSGEPVVFLHGLRRGPVDRRDERPGALRRVAVHLDHEI